MSVIDMWGSYVYRSKEYDKLRSSYYASIPDDISIYTDGSAIGNNNVNKDTPAGYGYIVIKGQTGKNHDKGEVLAEVSARVITDPENCFWEGAQHGSNNTGELTAFHAALKEIPIRGNGSFAGKITIYTDSQYAGNIADGSWNPSSNMRLARTIQKKWSQLIIAYGKNRLQWKHIKAHEGYLWNERADHLAYNAAKRVDSVPLDKWLVDA